MAVRFLLEREKATAKERAAKRAAKEAERTRGAREAAEAKRLEKERRKALASFMEAVFECDDEKSSKAVVDIHSKLLLQAVDADGSTPLHKAAGCCLAKLTEAILERKDVADAASILDNRGRTPLHRAATSDSTGEICAMLLKHPNCNVFVRDVEGVTALDLAQRWGFMETAYVISKAEYDAIAGKEKENRVANVASDTALREKQKRTVQRLGKDLVLKLQRTLKITQQMGGMKKLFKQFDKDKNGTLNPSELTALIRKEIKIPASSLSDDDIRAFVVAVDDDNSGELDGAELEDFIAHGAATFFADSETGEAMAEVMVEEKKELNQKQEKFIKIMGGMEVIDTLQHKLKRATLKYRTAGGFEKLFRKYDADKSGQLSADEFMVMVREELGLPEASISDKHIKYFCLALDDDGNQQLSCSEVEDFIRYGVETFFDGDGPAPETATKGNLSKQAKKLVKVLGKVNVQKLQNTLKAATEEIGKSFSEVFDKYDLDQNGTLTTEEFRRMIRMELKIDGRTMSDKYIQAFVDALDADGNGELSAEEIDDFIVRGAETFFDTGPKQAAFHLDINHLAGLSAVKESRRQDAYDLASFEGWPFVNEFDHKGRTMLHNAANKGYNEVCQALLSREVFLEADRLDSERATALHLAAGNRYVECCEAIVGSSLFTAINARDLAGRTALHLAALRGDQECYDIIAEREDCDAALPDYQGRYAPDYALERGLDVKVPDTVTNPEL